MASSPQGKKRLLFISNLFPSREDPVRGLDNAALLQALSREWDIRVISPRPVIPPWKKVQNNFREEDHRFEPAYISVPYLPKTGDRWNDRLMARALDPAVEQVRKDFRPQAMLASWLFPDGCAAASLADRHGLPLVLITQGTDTHRYLDFPVRKRKILASIEYSKAVVCRSGDLARRLASAGADQEKLKVIYNGIDPAVFRPRDRDATRRDLDLNPSEPLLLFVGNLLPVKDPLFLVSAVAELNQRRAVSGLEPVRLEMVGEGQLQSELKNEISRRKIEAEVDLPGRLPPVEIARWMNAADLLCLSSRNEGFPNVILEAMASDLPIVSTNVGGIAELVDHPARGRLVDPGNLESYVEALEAGLRSEVSPEPATTMALPEPGWDRAAREYGSVLESACSD